MKILRAVNPANVLRKRRRLTVGSAMLGLAIAAVFFAYFETDPQLGNPTAVWTTGLGMVLCPGSLLFVTSIDIEPQTTAFAITWLVIGVINFALYGAIGAAIGRFLSKSD